MANPCRLVLHGQHLTWITPSNEICNNYWWLKAYIPGVATPHKKTTVVTRLDIVVEVDVTGFYSKKLGVNEPMLYAIYRMLQDEKKGYPMEKLVRDLGVTSISYARTEEEVRLWKEFRLALRILAKAGVIEPLESGLVRIRKDVGWHPTTKKRRGLATHIFSYKDPLKGLINWNPEELYTEIWKQIFFHHVS